MLAELPCKDGEDIEKNKKNKKKLSLFLLFSGGAPLLTLAGSKDDANKKIKEEL